ncbi:hypothetical protein AMS59_20375 [Lysinibacillus sp. FJAT-14745]|nr:hypothetical protein AMS59_20375 [Lysinibacillus sp. FJAT-14745]
MLFLRAGLFLKAVFIWIRKFQSVATKYLDNYLYWFCWLEIDKHLANEIQVEQMLISACQNQNNTTVQMLRIA